MKGLSLRPKGGSDSKLGIRGNIFVCDEEDGVFICFVVPLHICFESLITLAEHDFFMRSPELPLWAESIEEGLLLLPRKSNANPPTVTGRERRS